MVVSGDMAMTAPDCCIRGGLWWRLCFLVVDPKLLPAAS